MTDFLAFRGPDAKATWIDGNVGFGHTLLKTTFEAEHEHQPFTLDGKVWVVADARIDAQAELFEELKRYGGGTGDPPVQGHGQDAHVTSGVTDVELILRAYHAWGENCVEHLLGDFAFGIWDVVRQRLVCARDHMGVKPFYYAHIGQLVVFSNTLDCIRMHPAVSDKLSDLAIADFLLFGWNQDLASTSFADIQRIPPAHRATWSGADLHISRYWTLPIDEPVFYRRAGDYVDQFKDLLRQAVTDRLRTRRIGIFMSGGLDSPTLAATTNDLLRERYGSADLKAFTSIASHGPNERYYAGLVADRLGIPIDFQVDDNKPVEPNWSAREFTPPSRLEIPGRCLPRRNLGERWAPTAACSSMEKDRTTPSALNGDLTSGICCESVNMGGFSKRSSPLPLRVRFLSGAAFHARSKSQYPGGNLNEISLLT